MTIACSSVPVDRSPFSWDKLLQDIVSVVLQHCFANGYAGRVLALAYTNHHFHQIVSSRVKEIDLKQICPLLDILDAKKLGIKVDDEPILSKLKAIRLYHTFVRCVEGHSGLTILTMSKGLTFRDLIDCAENAGILPTITWVKIPKEFEHIPVKATYRIIISNNIVQKIINGKLRTTRGRKSDYKEAVVHRIGFDQIPTLQEQVALCVYQAVFNNKYLYGENTYGSTMPIDKSPFMIGNCSPTSLHIISHVNNLKHCGAGGRKKLKGFRISC
jgi:hypothetical protein